MSDGDAGRSPNGRTPVNGDRTQGPADDDRPTTEMAPVAANGSSRGNGSPSSARPGAPRPATPSAPGQRDGTAPRSNGSGSNGSGSNGARPSGPQPTASGWTPPPLPGRQTPAPPAGGVPTPVVPKPSEDKTQPVAKGGPARKGAQAQPAPPKSAAPQAAPTKPVRPATGPPAGEPKSGPGVVKGPKTAPPAQGTGKPAPQASPTVVESGTAEAAAVPSAAPATSKPSFWSRLAEGLGFEKKSAEDAPKPATDAPAAAHAPAAAPVAASVPAPAAAAKGGPTTAKGGPTTAPAPTAPAALQPSPTTPKPSPAPVTPGPQQYRVGQTLPQPAVPGGPLPVPYSGQPAPGVRGGATALVPAAAGEVLAAGPATSFQPRPAVRRTRKARLRLSRLDPWSVMKTSFLFSIAAGIMLVVAVYGIWLVLSTSGLFTSVNDIVGLVVSTPGDTTPFRVEDYLNTQRVMGVAALVACVDVVIFTALATLGSFLYNLAATMLGGLEITLAED